MRYIPTFVRSVRGSFVMTSGSVMNGPASSGHVVKHRKLREIRLRMTTS